MKALFQKCIKNSADQRGVLMLTVIVFAAIATTVIIGLTNWGASMLQSIRNLDNKAQALELAEAGIDYYRWHLAHAPNDFKDGTNVAGPYVHPFSDKDGNYLGTFALTITPPPTGTTVVTIVSKGTVATSSISRSIKAVLAIPSLARYAAVANDNLRFGSGTEVFGPIHSNYGIRFDGIAAHNLVTSALDHYDDTDSDDCNAGKSFAVHTCNAPQDPQYTSPMPARSDLFIAGRQFPVPAIDFAGLTLSLSQLKTQAQTAGKYISGSGSQGYHIILNKSGDPAHTFRLYKVTSVQSPPGSCSNDASQTQWGTWTINNESAVNVSGSNVYNMPGNGIIFVEDNLWIEGTLNGDRITVAAAKFPDTAGQQPNITINSDLKYTSYTGGDVLGLIAQGNVNTGLGSANTQRIDGALVAQDGRVGRFYYASDCGAAYQRSSLTLYGMIASNIRYGFAYTDGTGYATRNIIYDSNLLYGPPPSFPLSSSQYQTLIWQEI